MDRKRPGPLLAIAILGLILGAMGVIGGCFGLVTQLTQDQINAATRAMLENQPGQTPEMLEQQDLMQERLRAITDPLMPALIAYQALNLIASLALAIGAWMVLQWKPKGLELFSRAALGSLLVEIPGAALVIYVQYQTKLVMSGYVTGLNDPALGAEGERAMGAVMDASGSLAMIVGIVWIVLKLGYYAWAMFYTRDSEVRALFAA
jgi:hypothetical protein